VEDEASKGASAAQTRFFEQKIEQFEAEFRDKEREIDSLRHEKRQVTESEQTKARELHEAKLAQES